MDQTGAERHATAEELTAYALDPSSLDPARVEHIGSCPVCFPEASWLRGAVEAVVRFALGESSAEEQVSIYAHLRGCASCRQEVEMTRATFADPLPAPDPIAAMKRLIAALVPAPALGTRGGREAGAPGSLEFEAGDVHVILRIVTDRPDADLSIVSGVLRGPTPAVQPEGVPRVALLYALPGSQTHTSGALVAEANVTASNDFDLLGVPVGTYRLEIVSGNEMIVVSPVTVPD
jgi:hypothetical protein